MHDGTVLMLLMGVVALSAIVGIYYCWVRKLKKEEPKPEPTQTGAPR
jgi:uncharacterized membrane protein YqhA